MANTPDSADQSARGTLHHAGTLADNTEGRKCVPRLVRGVMCVFLLLSIAWNNYCISLVSVANKPEYDDEEDSKDKYMQVTAISWAYGCVVSTFVCLYVALTLVIGNFSRQAIGQNSLYTTLYTLYMCFCGIVFVAVCLVVAAFHRYLPTPHICAMGVAFGLCMLGSNYLFTLLEAI